MGTSERIERERQAKRALIMEAARDLFLAHGYDAVTLRQIAERIEHSTTAIYVHFHDKRDLFLQIVRDDFARFNAALTVHATVADPVERIRLLGRSYVEFALTMPRSYEMIFMREQPPEVLRAMAESDAPSEDPHKDGYAALIVTCAEAIAQGRLREGLTDPFLVAQAVWSAVHGLVALRMRTEHSPELQWRSREAVLAALMDMICDGILRSR
jgi:AcrR family transcriptional regulator